MAIILTYDVDGAHNTVVKNTLKAAPYNYKDTLPGTAGGVTREYKLPNTTLYHASKTVEDAGSDIVVVTSACGAKLEKYLVLEVSRYRVNDPA